MNKKIKRIMACLMATASLATGMVGMSASAYAPTVTKNFTVGNSTATATCYKDSSHALASTALSGGRCDVSLTYSNKSASFNNYLNTTPDAEVKGSTGSASSSHSARKGDFSNSERITVY